MRAPVLTWIPKKYKNWEKPGAHMTTLLMSIYALAFTAYIHHRWMFGEIWWTKSRLNSEHYSNTILQDSVLDVNATKWWNLTSDSQPWLIVGKSATAHFRYDYHQAAQRSAFIH